MSDDTIKFLGTGESRKQSIGATCHENAIYIDIDNISEDESGEYICLNKATAVLLVRKIKLEISKIKNQ